MNVDPPRVGTVQADAPTDADYTHTGYQMYGTDAQAKCVSQYPAVCSACGAGVGRGTNSQDDLNGECYTCPQGKIYVGMSSGCVAPPPPPPPPPCDKCDGELLKCLGALVKMGPGSGFRRLHDATADCEPKSGPEGCQDALDCDYDKCGAADAADGFKTMPYCSDPSKFHKWKLVFIIVGAISAVRRLVILTTSLGHKFHRYTCRAVDHVKIVVVSTSHH
jgi:hypothetical protein